MAIALTFERKPQPRRAVYPTGDGKPMAETEWHVLQIVYNLSALRLHFAQAAKPVYVAGNNFLFYEEGNPRARLSPDTYVVLGSTTRIRDSYKVWEEGGRAPNVVFEITSKGTKDEDLGRKFTLYEQVLKVAEYFLFDPKGDYLTPRLRGFRLHEGHYQPIQLVDGRMWSGQLQLDLVNGADGLRFYNPAAGRFLPTLEEAEAQRAEAEAEVARLRIELESLLNRAQTEN